MVPEVKHPGRFAQSGTPRRGCRSQAAEWTCQEFGSTTMRPQISPHVGQNIAWEFGTNSLVVIDEVPSRVVPR